MFRSRKQNSGLNNNVKIGIIPLCTEYCAPAFYNRPLKKTESVVRRASEIAESNYELPHVSLAVRPHATIRVPPDGFS